MRLLGNGHAVIEYTGAWGRPSPSGVRNSATKPGRNSTTSGTGSSSELGERGRRMAELNRNLFIYPNMFLMDNNAVAIRTIQPTSAGYMDAAQYELAPREEASSVRAIRLESYVTFAGPGGLATPDDVEALESCQQASTTRSRRSGACSRVATRTAVPSLTGEEQIRELLAYVATAAQRRRRSTGCLTCSWRPPTRAPRSRTSFTPRLPSSTAGDVDEWLQLWTEDARTSSPRTTTRTPTRRMI